MFQTFFAVKLGWFRPSFAAELGLAAYILPAIVLALLSLATGMRLTRNSVAENLRADYVRTAAAKGLSRPRIVAVHVLRNSLIPVATYIGADLGALMGGAMVTEGIFNIPGVGTGCCCGASASRMPRRWSPSSASWCSCISSPTCWWTCCTPCSIRGSAMASLSEDAWQELKHKAGVLESQAPSCC